MLKFAANYCRFWVIDYYNISPLPHSTLSSKRKLYLLCLTLPSHQLLCILSKLDFSTRSAIFEPLHVPPRCDYSFVFCMLWIFHPRIVNNSHTVCQFVRRWHAANLATVIHHFPSKEDTDGPNMFKLICINWIFIGFLCFFIYWECSSWAK